MIDEVHETHGLHAELERLRAELERAQRDRDDIACEAGALLAAWDRVRGHMAGASAADRLRVMLREIR